MRTLAVLMGLAVGLVMASIQPAWAQGATPSNTAGNSRGTMANNPSDDGTSAAIGLLSRPAVQPRLPVLPPPHRVPASAANTASGTSTANGPAGVNTP